MRTTTSSGVTLEYPDAQSMAFNPFLLKASGASVDRLNITLSDGGSPAITKSVTFDGFGAAVYCDLQEWVQSYFNALSFAVDYTQVTEKTTQGMTLSFSVSAEAGGSVITTFSFTSFVVWGALAIGEHYNENREVTWFQGFPFSVGMYFATPMNVYLGVNGSPTIVSVINSQGIFNVIVDDAMGGTWLTLGELTNYVDNGTFDATFDLTFRGVSGDIVEKVKIKLVSPFYDEGYYLRWVDRHGFTCYWLFKSVSKQLKAESNYEYQRNNLLAYDQNYGFIAGAGRRIAYNRSEVIPVCAPLVTQSDWDYISDLATSPVVDLFMGLDENNVPQWTAVTIEAGTYTKTDDDLQDYLCNIVKPETPTQEL